MKFADYLRCDGCGRMIPDESFVAEGKRFCSRECYDFIQWYQEKKRFYMEVQKKEEKPNEGSGNPT